MSFLQLIVSKIRNQGLWLIIAGRRAPTWHWEHAHGAATSRSTLLRGAHWKAIAASDFFTVEVWNWRGLVTHYILFVIDLATRRVVIAGITPNPNEEKSRSSPRRGFWVS